jgi:hypothetical protein
LALRHGEIVKVVERGKGQVIIIYPRTSRSDSQPASQTDRQTYLFESLRFGIEWFFFLYFSFSHG